MSKTIKTKVKKNIVKEVVEKAVEQPVVNEPVVNEPVVNEPVVNEPVVNEPVVNEPVVNEPVVNEPVVNEPVVNEPVVNEPVVEKTYHLEIKMNDVIFKTDTNDLLQSLKDYEVPAMIKSETLITVVKGNKTRERALKTFEARRIFGNKTTLTLFADNLTDLVG